MKKNDLSGHPGTSMICADAGELHGRFSATPGDYFLLSPDHRFRCECGADMIEVRTRVVNERVGPS